MQRITWTTPHLTSLGPAVADAEGGTTGANDGFFGKDPKKS
jgi:hypothetical protein